MKAGLRRLHAVAVATVLAVTVAASIALAGESGIEIPTGQTITPTAANGAIFEDLDPKLPTAPELRAGHAAAVSVSPDGQLLAILTSGSSRSYDQNLKPIPDLSMEYVFLFDISGPRPTEQQVLRLPSTFQGLAWAPSSDRLYVSAGREDTVVEFVRDGSAFAAGRTFKLQHKECLGLNPGPGAPTYLGKCGAVTGGLAVSPDGARLLVANLQSDSVSLIDLKSGGLIAEQDLRPGIIDPRHRGEAGGSYPRAVIWSGNDRAYVASERDREVIALSVSNAKVTVVRRFAVHGQPVALLVNHTGSRLYAALATTGRVAIIDTARNEVMEDIDAAAPESIYANTKKLGGASSNALALTPDEGRLLVSNGGQNSVAIVRLSDRARGMTQKHNKKGSAHDDGDDGESAAGSKSTVIGLVPTGWYPTGVATSRSGATWYIVNGKSETGPNGTWCKAPAPAGSSLLCMPEKQPSSNPYAPNGFAVLSLAHENVWQLEKAGFLTMPAPSPLELARLTKQVAHNNHFDRPEKTAADERLFSFLHEHIRHVIYIIKENRTYDQLFGDLPVGNGDKRFTLFPQAITPNHHAIASHFVLLDNFLVSGEGSWSGWDWSVSAQTNDFRERQEPVSGFSGEATGFNRNINIGMSSSAQRHAENPLSPSDPDILPGEHDVTAPDGPGGEEGTGHIWDAALKAGVTIRNWGFFGENRIFPHPPAPLIHDPYGQKIRVFFPTKSALAPYSDPYFLDFGPAFPDFWRVKEWKRELAEFAAKHSAPNLMLIRLGNDHFGSFDVAIDGVNTPDTQMADNDYALGLILEAVATSPFASDTLIVSVEDDASDGPDHVNAHRSVVLFAGPYVRRHAVVSSRYTTVNLVKTIEKILGIGPIGLNDALAAPMSDIFDPTATSFAYEAIVPDVLRSTQLPLPPPKTNQAAHTRPRHSNTYWAHVMAGQDFSGADRFDTRSFNRALWRGLKGDEPYPATPTGAEIGRALQ